MALLEVTNLGISFGGLQAVSGFRLSVDSGHLYGLIGPNGAGKTTAFNMLTGMYEPDEGKIILDGVDITGKSPEFISKAGIARTFQNIRLFKRMSVLDNVKVGMHNKVPYGMWHGVLRDGVFRAKEKEMDQRAMNLLEVFGIADKAGHVASQLPYGEQRKLDEPAAGMNPNETIELRETVRKVRDDFGIAILLIEHDMKFVMGICEEITVLEYGKIIAHGDPETVSNDPRVIAAYLGGDDD